MEKAALPSSGGSAMIGRQWMSREMTDQPE
jgi:hypothetical protein